MKRTPSEWMRDELPLVVFTIMIIVSVALSSGLWMAVRREVRAKMDCLALGYPDAVVFVSTGKTYCTSHEGTVPIDEARTRPLRMR